MRWQARTSTSASCAPSNPSPHNSDAVLVFPKLVAQREWVGMAAANPAIVPALLGAPFAAWGADDAFGLLLFAHLVVQILEPECLVDVHTILVWESGNEK